MKCKDVTAYIDLGGKPAGVWGRIQYYAHVLHCHPCQTYLKMCRRLTAIVKSSGWVGAQNLKIARHQLAILNQKLLQKYSAGPASPGEGS